MMPTPYVTYALVAQTLAGVDPDDRAAVTAFYEHTFVSYPRKKREMIAGFIITYELPPDPEALRNLVILLDKT
jgi:hypothetical protein